MIKTTIQTLAAACLCWLSALHGFAAERYGGVEIGAKGVKATAIEVDASTEPPTLKVLELDKKTVDVTISRLKGKKFDSALVQDTALVVKDFIEALKTELNVPVENIQVVASSGVPFTDNIAELTSAIEEQAKKELSRIDAIEEATLTAVALVPQELRTKVLVVDIGSGNTKGGTFLDDSGAPEQFTTLEVPFGTQTLTKAIDGKLAEATGAVRADVGREVAQELVGKKLAEQVAEHAELGERPQVLFAGGSVWACVTIIKPETALEPFPTLTAADIKAYVELINANAGKYPAVDFAKVANEGARAAAQKDYDRITGAGGEKPVFRPDELQTGAAILEQVSEALQFETRSVRFDRKAVTAWITAKVTPEELRSQLPAALGRNLEVAEKPAETAAAEAPAAPAETPAVAAMVQRFGGVEIGAKGVKVTAIEIDPTKEPATLRVLEMDKKTVDVTISRLKGKKFDSALVQDTALVVKDFIEALKAELKVPEENIEVVASSGVPFTDNIAELTAAIEEHAKKELHRIDAIEEATLTAVALVPQELRTSMLVVDIGSGNTKGGTFLDESGAVDKFTTLEVRYGTQTLTKEIDTELAVTPGGVRADVGRAVAEEVIGKKIAEQLTEHPELARPKVLFAGGTVWACVTMIKPESALNPFPILTAADIKAYVELINTNAGKYPEVDFTKIADETARAAAQKDYDRITGKGGDKPVFRPDELQSGAALLEQVSEKLQFESRKVYFDRKAVTAWITARITPEELRPLLPAALGRDFAKALEVAEVPATEVPAPPAPKKVVIEIPAESKVVVVPKPVTPPKTVMPPKELVTILPKPATPPQPVLNDDADPINDPPVGLTMPVVDLLTELAFLPSQNARETVDYTPEFCLEVAVKCYTKGRYIDSLAFAKHAGQSHETPVTLFLEGLNQIALNQSADAAQSAQRLREAGGSGVNIIGPLREHLNGPRTVRLVRMIDGR